MKFMFYKVVKKGFIVKNEFSVNTIDTNIFFCWERGCLEMWWITIDSLVKRVFRLFTTPSWPIVCW